MENIFHQMILLEGGRNSASRNMAIDEALFLEKDLLPCLRFYSWEGNSLSFGYFQKYEESRKKYPQCSSYVRRITGGGAVLHTNEFTYSIVMKPNCPAFKISPFNFYKEIHQKISFSFSSKAKPLIKESASKKGNICFESPSQNDLLFEGEKIAGAAQKKNIHFGLLFQGSIKKNLSLHFTSLKFAQNLSKEIIVNPQFSTSFWGKVEKLEKKYSSCTWLKKR